LRHRIFFALFVAQLVSNMGTLMQNVGSAWLMGDLHASTGVVALVQTATFLPVLLIGIPAGALADIADRRRVILGTQAWMMTFALLLAVLSFADKVTPGLLLALTFGLGLGTAVNGPAFQAIQPDLVPKEDVPQALALGALTYNLGRAVGPALGGLIIAASGPEWVFAINALSFFGVLAVVYTWRSPTTTERLPLESLSGATRACLRYGAHAPILRGVLARTALFIVPASALQALLPSVVRLRLGLGSGGYGILLGAFGIGAAYSAIVRPRIARRLSPDHIVAASTIVVAAALLTVGLVRVSWLAGVALFVGGFAWTLTNTTTNIAAQAALAPWVRARGLGLYLLVITGGIALGSALWGAVSSWSLVGAHVVAAASAVVGVAGVRRWRLRAADGVDVTPVPGDDPVVSLTPRASDGPVIVTITYHVPADSMPGFVETMRAIERHRRRTGAYQWGLFRDLAAPMRFVEIFHVSSWVEHLRQHQRDTVASDTAFDGVRGFLVGQPVEHLISAYSPGALDPIVPYQDTDHAEVE
jgi:predicted MFS family arabinose efflux permease